MVKKQIHKTINGGTAIIPLTSSPFIDATAPPKSQSPQIIQQPTAYNPHYIPSPPQQQLLVHHLSQPYPTAPSPQQQLLAHPLSQPSPQTIKAEHYIKNEKQVNTKLLNEIKKYINNQSIQQQLPIQQYQPIQQQLPIQQYQPIQQQLPIQQSLKNDEYHNENYCINNDCNKIIQDRINSFIDDNDLCNIEKSTTSQNSFKNNKEYIYFLHKKESDFLGNKTYKNTPEYNKVYKDNSSKIYLLETLSHSSFIKYKGYLIINNKPYKLNVLHILNNFKPYNNYIKSIKNFNINNNKKFYEIYHYNFISNMICQEYILYEDNYETDINNVAIYNKNELLEGILLYSDFNSFISNIKDILEYMQLQLSLSKKYKYSIDNSNTELENYIYKLDNDKILLINPFYLVEDIVEYSSAKNYDYTYNVLNKIKILLNNTNMTYKDIQDKKNYINSLLEILKSLSNQSSISLLKSLSYQSISPSYKTQ